MISNKEVKLLYKKFRPSIVRNLKKYNKTLDKDKIIELTNDIFMKIYQNYNTFPQENNEISKYIFITCRNHMLNYRKIKEKESFIEYTDNDDIVDIVIDEHNNIDTDYIFNDYINYEYSKMDRIKRDVINYKNMGYNLNEISKITNIPKTNVYRLFNEIKEEYANI